MSAIRSLFALWISAAVLFSCNARAAKHLELPHYKGRPGQIVPVPITLSSAASLASAKITVNYDPNLLAFVAARNEGLGAAFEMIATAEDGVVTLMFTRSTSMVSGSGILAVIDFQVNATAENGLASDLVIASHELGDETGVRKLELVESVTAQSGSLEVTLNSVDNDRDHIPDDWETGYGLSTVVSNAFTDMDGDGISDFAEYAFGLNPKVPEALLSNGVRRVLHSDGAEYLAVELRRRTDAGTALTYFVEESPSMTGWTAVSIPSNAIGSAVNIGGGMESIIVRGNIPITGAAARPIGFLRVKVGAP